MKLWPRLLGKKPPAPVDPQFAAAAAYLAQFRDENFKSRLSQLPLAELKQMKKRLSADPSFSAYVARRTGELSSWKIESMAFMSLTLVVGSGGLFASTVLAIPAGLSLLWPGISAAGLIAGVLSLRYTWPPLTGENKRKSELAAALLALDRASANKGKLEDELRKKVEEIRELNGDKFAADFEAAFRKKHRMDPPKQLESGIKGYLPAPKRD